jgi:hypothetical protein
MASKMRVVESRVGVGDVIFPIKDIAFASKKFW